MNKESRLKNTVYNTFSNITIRIFTTIFSFVVRTFFIKLLGEQLLGLDGLLTNILSLLSLADLGLSTAISVSLYEPLARKNSKAVSRLMSFIRRVYRKIALLIFVIGLLIIPFLHVIVKDYTGIENLYLIYILYLINTVSTYFVSYSAVLLEADQKNYRLFVMTVFYDFMTYSLQLISLLLFKNFILYLLIQFVMRFLQRVQINSFIHRSYKEVEFDYEESITEEDKKKISTNIKGLLYHKIGEYAVNSTDNILISSIVNIATTGLYYNYLSLASVLQGLINAVITAPTSSFGNLNVDGSVDSKKNVFKLINYICFFITGIGACGFYFCVNRFISLWIGDKYLLSNICVIIISLNLYLSCTSSTLTTIKNSTGLYYQDRIIPIIQAVVNLIVSIIAGIKFGLIGILFGTTVSYVFVVLIFKPYYIYKIVFNSRAYSYYSMYIKYSVIAIISFIAIRYLVLFLNIPYGIFGLLLTGLISVMIYMFIFILLTCRTNEFAYYKNLLVSCIKSRRN